MNEKRRQTGEARLGQGEQPAFDADRPIASEIVQMQGAQGCANAMRAARIERPAQLCVVPRDGLDENASICLFRPLPQECATHRDGAAHVNDALEKSRRSRPGLVMSLTLIAGARTGGPHAAQDLAPQCEPDEQQLSARRAHVEFPANRAFK